MPFFQKSIAKIFRGELTLLKRTILAGEEISTAIKDKPWMLMYSSLASEIVPRFAQDSFDSLMQVKSKWLGWNATAKVYVLVNGAKFVKDITDTTRSQIQGVLDQGYNEGWGTDQIASAVEGLYLTSIIPYRSEVIARTEIVRASNYGSHMGAKKTGLKLNKEWIATPGARTRPAHAAANGQTVGIDDPFIVDGDKLMYPGDTSLGAKASNVIQCRCASGYVRSAETLKPVEKPKKPVEKPKKPVEKPVEKPKLGVIPKPPKFNDVKKAEDWAKENLGIEYVNYSDFDAVVADAVNAGVHKFSQVFPRIRPKWLCGDKEYYKKIKKEEGKINPIELVTSDYNAFFNGFRQALVLSTKYTNNSTKWKEVLAATERIGWAPPETGTIEGVIIHELGHATHTATYELLSNPNKLFNFVNGEWDKFTARIKKEKPGKVVSYYATDKKEEFVAECLREYVCSSKPRETAKRVGDWFKGELQ